MNYWYLLAAIPVFGLLVFVHELGHFLTAKWAGIRVEEFGLGFPPRIVGFRKRDRGGWQVIWLNNDGDAESNMKQNPFGGTSGGVTTAASESSHTIYSLNFLPIGGFVRMPGENGDVNDPDGNYDPGSFAAKSAGKRIIVLVAGVTMNVLLAMILFTVAYSLGEPVADPSAKIGTVTSNSPAQAAGLRAGDTILAVNGKPIKLFEDLRTEVSAATQAHQNSDTAPVTLVVQHQGETAPVTIVVQARVHPGPGQGALGVGGNVIVESSPVWQAPFKGIVHTVDVTRQFIDGIVQMIVGKVPAQVVGPVGIVQITGEVAQTIPNQGWWNILSLTAILSLNLAIVNILPFPALDGGRILLILIELVRGGKRLKPEREGIINFIGMAVLLGLMLVITINDIIHPIIK